MWIVEEEAEADIASDLSAFHRIDDVEQIDGPRYFSLAQRLTAYQGVRGAVVAERAQRERDGGTAPSGRHSAGARSEVSNSTAFAEAGGWVEHVKASEEG